MSASIPVSFITQFESEVKLAYQRMGALLRGTTRETHVTGSTARFPKLASGIANQKARNGDITPLDLAHSNATVTMEDWYAPDYIEDLDALKTNVDFRTDYARTLAMSLGRRADQIKIDAAIAGAGATVDDDIGGPDSGLNITKILETQQLLLENDVPMGANDLFWIIAPQQLNDLNTIDQFRSIDFNSNKPLASPATNFQFLGFTFIVHSGLTLVVEGGTFVRQGLVWHRDAIGTGINKEIEVRVDNIPEKVSTLVNGVMSMGVTTIDADGVFVVECNEGA